MSTSLFVPLFFIGHQCRACGLRMRSRNLCGRLGKPFCERDLPELRAVFGDERSLLHFDAVVARVRVSDNLAWIFARSEPAPDELIEPKLFRTTDFYDAVCRWTYGNSGQVVFSVCEAAIESIAANCPH